MIGARFYSQIDAMQLQCDIFESEMRKETNYERLLKLVIKLACINEWPEYVNRYYCLFCVLIFHEYQTMKYLFPFYVD